MTMMRRMLGGSALPKLTLMAAVMLPTAVLAQTVTLRSQDGSVDISGELVDFAENIYVIRTLLGELRLSAERVSCSGDGCPVFEAVVADVNFAGSDTVGLGVMPLMLEGYAGFLDAESTVVSTGQNNEFIASFIGDGGFGDEIGSYRVSSTTSGDAFSGLLDTSAQIGMSSRRIVPTEARALRDAGGGNMVSPQQEHIVAIDSIVVITHPDNPVRRITMEDVAAIYRGRITNWSQLGGPDLEIKVIDRPEGGGTKSVFTDRVLGDNATISPNALIAVDNNEMARMVNSDVASIGYTGYAFQRGARAMTLVNECGIAMVPDAFSARTEEYSLQRRLYLYNRNDTTSAPVQSFLDYALSSDADQVIIKAGFIDLGVDRRAQPIDSERALRLLDPNVDPYEGGVMREMVETMVNYDRLSTTFRFRTGSSKLDERGLTDMARLADFLEEQPAGTKVMLVGFTDDVGAFDSNRRLAEGRARQVQSELLSFAGSRIDGLELQTAAYGEVAPSACNVSDTGRAINRRVEVWLQTSG